MTVLHENIEQMEVLLEEPFVKVLYDRPKKMGIIVWNGNPKADQYRKPFISLLEWAKKGNKVERFLSDTRNQGIINPENRRWFEREMIPASIEAGLRRAAVVTSGNVFKAYYLNLILSTVNKFNMPFKIFTTEEKAIDFLMEE